MKRLSVAVGAFEVNCSVIGDAGRAWIVDPGQDADRIIGLLEREKLSPVAIMLTHAHFDHIGAIPELQVKFPDLPVYVHERDVGVLTHPMNNLSPFYSAIPLPRHIIGKDELESVGDMEIIETPGHTPGGVCYYFPAFGGAAPLLLSGDTLFAGSAGRTDLPGGDMATLTKSLKKLALLPDATIVVPGHGAETTIGAEKRGNPFLSDLL